MDKLNATASKDDDENFQYDITAVIKAVCTLDSKVLGEYKNAVAGASNTEATKKEAI